MRPAGLWRAAKQGPAGLLPGLLLHLRQARPFFAPCRSSSSSSPVPSMVPRARAEASNSTGRVTLDFYLGSYCTFAKLEPFIRDVLRLGAYQILYMDRVPDSAAVNEPARRK